MHTTTEGEFMRGHHGKADLLKIQHFTSGRQRHRFFQQPGWAENLPTTNPYGSKKRRRPVFLWASEAQDINKSIQSSFFLAVDVVVRLAFSGSWY